MPSDDLKTYATSNTDFYALLDLTPSFSQKELDRQWRKTALKYHPDKVGSNDTSAKEKFHLAQIGYDLLSDPTARALYDNARNAREQRKRQSELFEGRRRQMRDDLEARERGVKRNREEEEGDEEKLERELRRLAEDGKRRRREREERLRKEVEEEKMRQAQNGGAAMSPAGGSSNLANGLKTGVSELDRTVKVRWPIDNREGDSVTEAGVESLFSTFGKVETVTMLRPKELRLGGSKHQKKKRQLAAICMVQYASIVGAHTAVEDFHKQDGKKWSHFDSVLWAANKEPESINAFNPISSSPLTPAKGSSPHLSFLDGDSRPSTPTPLGTNSASNGNGPRKMPSFSSFSTAAFSTPTGSPFGKSLGANSPSLEELTMIRLKNAEKKRLAEELQRQDEQAAAAEAMAEEADAPKG
ncbi:MAG: hypothetical protein L6R41_008274 [Letrouitia leprolyta]|nr:MAG: hypothetical protein L6R41_008274 [Letrouitia leprolyta]